MIENRICTNIFDENENEEVYDTIKYILEELINSTNNKEGSISFIKEKILLTKYAKQQIE